MSINSSCIEQMRRIIAEINTVGQRIAVAASCAVFYYLANNVPSDPSSNVYKLSMLALLACVEKVCAILNSISVERDWVSRYNHHYWRLFADVTGRRSRTGRSRVSAQIECADAPHRPTL